MMKVKIAKTLIALIFLVILIPQKAKAIEDPLAVPNNRFGIHIIGEQDLEKAAELVNSNQGDWGYVTIVIRNDERDVRRWQRVFDSMRELHLIPLVRVATIQTGDGWEKPKHAEIDAWVSFFDQLNWVIKNRYIIIGNEPNHAKEWGGEIDPAGYSNYLYNFSKKLKERSDEFFILPAGFDASAPNSKETMSEDLYLDLMMQNNINTFEYVDGWTSHSYPNPNFSGSEFDTGRGSIETFKWELELLKILGVNKYFPVFITETGWANDTDNVGGYLNEGQIGNKLTHAFQNVWNDEQVVAVTPFILNYTTEPFSIFSWIKPDGAQYQFFDTVKNLHKSVGAPVQKNIIRILVKFTPEIFTFSEKMFSLAIVKNTGQKIWKRNILQSTDSRNGKVLINPIKYFGETKPGEHTLAFIKNN